MTDIARSGSRFSTGQSGPIESSSLFVGSTAVSASVPVPVNSEGARATYAYAATGVTPAATPTDVVTLTGSATKTIKVKRVTFHGIATTAGSMAVLLIKRTAANTAGTATAPTPGKFDSTDGTATAAIAQYSANATGLGTGIAIDSKICNFGVAGAAGQVVFDFATNQDKPLFLRGATQILAVNLNGAAVPTGGTFGYSLEWEEV